MRKVLGGFMLAAALLAPDYSYAAIPPYVDPQVEGAVHRARQDVARQVYGRADRHTELPGNVDNAVPTNSINQLMGGWNALSLSKLPLNLGQMFGGNLAKGIMSLVKSTARGNFGSGGLGGIMGLITSDAGAVPTAEVENACKTAVATPEKSAKILASPIVAYATPINGATVCPNGLITCFNNHYAPSELNPPQMGQKSPVGSGTKKCPGQGGLC